MKYTKYTKKSEFVFEINNKIFIFNKQNAISFFKLIVLKNYIKI